MTNQSLNRKRDLKPERKSQNCRCCKYRFLELTSEKLCKNCSYGYERAKAHALRIGGVRVEICSKQADYVKFVCKEGHSHTYKLSASNYWDGECNQCEKEQVLKAQKEIDDKKKKMQDDMFASAEESTSDEESSFIHPEFTFAHYYTQAQILMQQQAL